ncbi:MAG: zinc-ribbon domain-containing protein [Desulfobacteraceae bacterium]|jgi:hypothetical protein
MEVTCDHCKKTLRIPDEKVPQNQVIQIACPACKNKITIDTRVPEAPAAPDMDEAGAEAADYGEDTSIGFYEEGTRLALVLDSDEARKNLVRAAVEDQEFRFVESLGTREAIGKMRFHVFDLIVLADGFDGQPLEHSPIINSLNHSPMPFRRKTFLALIGDQFQTMDNMMAFALSANLVIRSSDAEKLSAILKKALAENERFYKVFMDVMKETGKA